ncbi:MAG: VWA domain-containing protein, partial [Olsenella sp.]
MRKAMAILLSIVLAVSTCGCVTPLTEGEKSPATPSTTTAEGQSSATAGGTSFVDSSEEAVPEEPEVNWNTEEYAAIVEHGFTSTASDPYSTFSADVDTASYANLRRMISEGYPAEDIPSGAVRIEEMLNYFDYDYADPSGSDAFGVTAQIADCPWNPDTKLLVMGLKTRDLDYAETRGNNLVFLIDTSGSMDSPDKLGLLKRSFSYLVDNLNPDDTVS